MADSKTTNQAQTTTELAIMENPAVQIIRSVVELTRAQKNGDEDQYESSYRTYCECFEMLFGHIPTSDSELNPTLNQIATRYGTMIVKAQEAQIRAMVAYFSAQSMARRANRKITIKFNAPSQETIDRLHKNLANANEKRSSDNQMREYIPEKPEEYVLNLAELQSRFQNVARHMEYYTKMTGAIIKRGRVKNKPESFKGTFNPVYLGSELKAFFEHSDVSSVLEISDKKLAALFREHSSDKGYALTDKDFGFSLKGLRGGYAMRHTVTAALYAYASARNLLRTLEGKSSTTGIMFDDALTECFASGDDSIFDRLVRGGNGNVQESVDVDFTKKESENIDAAMSAAKESGDKASLRSLKKLVELNKGAKFVPIYQINTLITLALDVRETTSDGKVVSTPRMDDEELTSKVKNVMLADYYHISAFRDTMRNKDIARQVHQLQV